MYGIRSSGFGRWSKRKLEESAGGVRCGSCGHCGSEEHGQVGKRLVFELVAEVTLT